MSLRWAIARVFNTNDLPGQCSCCDAQAVVIIMLHWQFTVPMQRFTLYAGGSNVPCNPTTAHAVCDSCAQQLQHLGQQSLWARRIVVALIMLAGLITFFVIRMSGTTRGNDLPQVLFTLGVFGALLFVDQVLPLYWSRRTRKESFDIQCRPGCKFVAYRPARGSRKLGTHCMSDRVAIISTTIDSAAAIASVIDPAAGGVDVFLGTTREETRADGVALLALDYEAYSEMALAQMKSLRRRRTFALADCPRRAFASRRPGKCRGGECGDRRVVSASRAGV